MARYSRDVSTRTTIALDDRLLARAKQAAAAKHRTLGEFLEEGIRLQLARAEDRPRPASAELPVSTASGGSKPGIDPHSNASLYDALDPLR